MSRQLPSSPCCINWLVIPAPDIERARSFYERVFGFRFSSFSPTFLTFKAGNISGALNADRAVSEGGVVLSITVDDLEETLGAIAREGGVVVSGPVALGDEGERYAVFRDPNGNELEVHAV